MIPDRNEIRPVILQLLDRGTTLSSDEIREQIAVHFRLTEEERRRMRGPHPEYANETAWALVGLQRDGLIKKPDPNRLAYRITNSGRHAES